MSVRIVNVQRNMRVQVQTMVVPNIGATQVQTKLELEQVPSRVLEKSGIIQRLQSSVHSFHRNWYLGRARNERMELAKMERNLPRWW